MYGTKALELIKELQRNAGALPPYSEDGIRQVLEECRGLFEQNQQDVSMTVEGQQGLFSGVHLRHACLERNRRCLMAYVFNRLAQIRDMRWQFGSVLPADVKQCLSEQEIQWFTAYCRSLASYMRSIGSHGGLDLTQDIKPPKSLYIEVRCLVDHGEFETEDGDIIVLTKNSQHFLPRSQCERLIRQGILEHILS